MPVLIVGEVVPRDEVPTLIVIHEGVVIVVDPVVPVGTGLAGIGPHVRCEIRMIGRYPRVDDAHENGFLTRGRIPRTRGVDVCIGPTAQALYLLARVVQAPQFREALVVRDRRTLVDVIRFRIENLILRGESLDGRRDILFSDVDQLDPSDR